MIDISTYEAFLKNKQAFLDALKEAVASAMAEMGDDMNGVEWFNPRAEFYHKNQKVRDDQIRRMDTA